MEDDKEFNIFLTLSFLNMRKTVQFIVVMKRPGWSVLKNCALKRGWLLKSLAVLTILKGNRDD